jgi:putative membrane protein
MLGRRAVTPLVIRKQRSCRMKFTATILAACVAAFAFAQAPPTDQSFLDKLAQGNMAEVEIGELAENKGTSAEVKEFGAMMVEQHGKALDKIRSVAKSEGVTLPTAPSDTQMDTLKTLQAKEGARFDAEYLAHMVKAHEETVSLLKSEIETGQDAQTKALAQELLPTVQNHLRHAYKLAGKDEAAATMPK